MRASNRSHHDLSLGWKSIHKALGIEGTGSKNVNVTRANVATMLSRSRMAASPG